MLHGYGKDLPYQCRKRTQNGDTHRTARIRMSSVSPFLILENRKRLAGVRTGDTQGYIKAC